MVTKRALRRSKSVSVKGLITAIGPDLGRSNKQNAPHDDMTGAQLFSSQRSFSDKRSLRQEIARGPVHNPQPAASDSVDRVFFAH